jgi:hypothetical protein
MFVEHNWTSLAPERCPRCDAARSLLNMIDGFNLVRFGEWLSQSG